MSLNSQIERNKAYLRNLFNRGPFQGHAFVAAGFAQPVPFAGLGDYTNSDKPVTEFTRWSVGDYHNRCKMLEATGHDGVPLAPMITGTHIYAAAFGCEVKDMEDSMPVALHRVSNAEEAAKIEKPDLWSCPTLVRTFEFARAVLDELGPETPIGVPDMQTGFDIACQIWDKSDLYCAIMDEDEAEIVKELSHKCHTLLMEFLTAWRKEFPTSSPNHCPGDWCPPELGPWVSNDECGLFGNDQFKEFCLPELVDMAATFGSLGMHCCAAAEHQFELFKEVPNFYAFNRVEAQQGYQPTSEILGGPDGPVLDLAWMDVNTKIQLIQNAPEGTRFIFNIGDGTIEGTQCELDQLRAISPRND